MPYQAPGAPQPYQAPGAPQPYYPPQQDMSHQQQPNTVIVQQDAGDQKHGKFGKMGGKLGNAAVQGAGFGFGASIASNLVNAVL